MSCARVSCWRWMRRNCALRFRARGVEQALAVGGEQPVLLGVERVRAARVVGAGVAHVLARRESDAGQQGIGAEHLAHARAEVVDGHADCRCASRDAVLAAGAVGVDVPGEDVERDVAIVRVLHHAPPESDLLPRSAVVCTISTLAQHRRRARCRCRCESSSVGEFDWSCAAHRRARRRDIPEPSPSKGTGADSTARRTL